jgi:hypothetical protein
VEVGEWDDGVCDEGCAKAVGNFIDELQYLLANEDKFKGPIKELDIVYTEQDGRIPKTY